MRKTQLLIGIALCGLAIFTLVGCDNPKAASGTPPSSTDPAPNPPPGGGSPASFTGPHVYVVSDYRSPTSVLAFPKDASGETKPVLDIVGSQVSIDDAGNLYLLAASSIDVYSAIPASGTATKIRSLPVGPNTKIPEVSDVVAGPDGEIYVSDSKGIAVFSPTATGNADPVRYITPLPPSESTAITPDLLAIDKSGNLYVATHLAQTISVFGPTANGNAVAARTIAGPLTNIGGTVESIATDTAGNLYVVSFQLNPASASSAFGVFVFGPQANGNVAPQRFITTPGMYPYFFSDSVAVDSAGTIYVSGGSTAGVPTVFEFSSDANGSVTPLNTVTLSGWLDSPDYSRIAVY